MRRSGSGTSSPSSELLAPAGYRSFGITANAHLDARFGFAQGFDRYRCVGFRDLAAVEAVVREWRDEIAASAPWFVWVHLFDPHAPYTENGAWIREQRPGFAGLPEPLASANEGRTRSVRAQ